METNGNIIQRWICNNFFKNKHCLFTLLNVLVVLMAYLYFIHPWFSVLVIPPLGEHYGLKYYTSDKYLRYEGGELFQDYLNSFDFVDHAEAVDFYHVDHWVRDNPFYGKYFDVFSTDFRLDQESYNKFRDDIAESGRFSYECVEADYEIWLQEDLPNVFLIAINDEHRIVRCILTTDCDRAIGIVGGFSRHTGLTWEIE